VILRKRKVATATRGQKGKLQECQHSAPKRRGYAVDCSGKRHMVAAIGWRIEPLGRFDASTTGLSMLHWTNCVPAAYGCKNRIFDFWSRHTAMSGNHIWPEGRNEPKRT
jgi:hypothetical protein